jgi:hypothetical protein
MKNAGGCAAIAPRIMEHALFNAVGLNDIGGKLITF